MPSRHGESSQYRAKGTLSRPLRYPEGVAPVLSKRLSGGLAWQLSYAFEQTAEPIKMKDFAAYTRLMRGALEFDEVRARDRYRKCSLQPS